MIFLSRWRFIVGATSESSKCIHWLLGAIIVDIHLTVYVRIRKGHQLYHRILINEDRPQCRRGGGALWGNVGAEMKTCLSCLHSFALSLLNLQSRFNICMRNVVQFI